MVYVRAKRLHECVLQFEDECLERATLIPFFDREGITQELLLIDHASQTARVCAFEPKLVQVPLFKRGVQLRCPLSALARLEHEQAESLGELWHFDPWWLLDRAPFEAQSTTPRLKLTNCADLLGVVNPGLGFRRDLSRVNWLFYGAEQASAKGWKARFLPERQPQVPVVRRGRARWILDPIWERE